MALLKRVMQDGRAALQPHTERGFNKGDLLGTETAQKELYAQLRGQ